jgi:hypothetical protein
MHGNGAIGRRGNDETVVVNLSATLTNYALPDPAQNEEKVAEAVKSSLELLSLGGRIGFPALGIAYLAPLTEFMAPDFSMFISGATGGFKSCVTALIQAHFGKAFDDRNLPGSWSSTANALEIQASLAKNVIFTIDDFKPGHDRNENAKLFQKADRIFRGVGNQAGRGRLGSSAELKASPIPRCVVLASGEDIPPGHSCRARILILEIKKGDVSRDQLTALQRRARDGDFALAMSAFIRWIADRHDHLRETLPMRHQSMRSELQGKGEHFRTLDAVAKLIVVLETLATFAIETGALSEREKQGFMEKARGALIQLGASQDEHQAAEDPCTAVLEGIRSLLSGGQAHLVRAEDGEMPSPPERWGWAKRGARIFSATGDPDVPVSEYAPQGSQIGWLGDREILLNADMAYAALERLKGAIPFSRTMLWRRMKERGLLICEADKTTARRTVHGHGRAPVVVIPESKVYPSLETGTTGAVAPFTRQDNVCNGLVAPAAPVFGDTPPLDFFAIETGTGRGKR